MRTGAKRAKAQGWRERSSVRRTSAGAIMTEAIVVIPTFTIIFFSTVFTWQMYSAKLQIMGAARADVWTYAIKDNCGSNGNPAGNGETFPAEPLGTLGSGNVGTDPGGIGGNATSGGFDSNQVQGQLGNGIVSPPDLPAMHRTLGMISAQPTGATVNLASTSFGVTVNASTQMMCNEPPYNGSIIGMFKEAWQVVTQW